MPRTGTYKILLFAGYWIVLLFAPTGTTALLTQDDTAVPSAGTAAEDLSIEHFFGWQDWTENSGFDLNNCQIIAAGDINSDGLEDLICPYNYGEGRTRTYVQLTGGMGLSNWQSQRPTLQVQFDLGKCRPLLPGDVSGDGLTDLVCVYDYGVGATRTFVQLNGGSDEEPFRAWGGVANEFDPDQCKSMIIGDANGDGFDDVICPRDYGNEETRTFVQFSEGDSLLFWLYQSFSWQEQFDLERCAAMLSGDVNNDGEIDLICPYNHGDGQTRTYVQLSAGKDQAAFELWAGLSSQFGMDNCRLLTVGDINADGFDDLVCVYDYGSSTGTYVQMSSGTNLTIWSAYTDALQNQFDPDLCTFSTGDLNVDGRLDLFCNYDYGSGSTATFVQMARENSYTSWQTATSTTSTGQFDLNKCVGGILPGDYNGDGYIDLACLYDYGSGLNRTFVQLAVVYRQHLPFVPGS